MEAVESVRHLSIGCAQRRSPVGLPWTKLQVPRVNFSQEMEMARFITDLFSSPEARRWVGGPGAPVAGAALNRDPWLRQRLAASL